MSIDAWVLRLGAAGLIALAGMALFQDRLLYYPEKAALADMLSPGLAAWPSPQDFRGLLA